MDSQQEPNQVDPAAMPTTTAESTLSGSRVTHDTTPTRFVMSMEPLRLPAVRQSDWHTDRAATAFMGNLDNYDPAITDALAEGREVILTDNAGVVVNHHRRTAI